MGRSWERTEKPVLTLKQIKGRKKVIFINPQTNSKVGIIIFILYMRMLSLRKIKLPKEVTSKWQNLVCLAPQNLVQYYAVCSICYFLLTFGYFKPLLSHIFSQCVVTEWNYVKTAVGWNSRGNLMTLWTNTRLFCRSKWPMGVEVQWKRPWKPWQFIPTVFIKLFSEVVGRGKERLCGQHCHSGDKHYWSMNWSVYATNIC